MIRLSAPRRIPSSPSSPLPRSPITPLFATLRSRAQITENKTTLTLVFATLTRPVDPKSFACHSCKKRPGWGVSLNCQSAITTHPLPSFSTSSKHATHSNHCNSILFRSLLHKTLYTRGGGSTPSLHLPLLPPSAIIIHLMGPRSRTISASQGTF